MAPRKQLFERTPSPLKVKKGRVTFSPAPKRKAPTKPKSAQSTSATASPASASKQNLTVRRKVKACLVQLEQPKKLNPSPSNNPESSSSGTGSKLAPKKRRRRRRRIITVLQTATLKSKKPMSTLSNHVKYLNALQGKMDKLMHETSCTSRRVLVLEQLEDEVVGRYVKLRSLSIKKAEEIVKRKGRILTRMEDRINDLQQTIETTKLGLTDERTALHQKTGERICCYFCNSLSQNSK